jgi:rhodanese-related sulfurtransferase
MYVGHGEGFINIPAYNWSLEPKSIDERVKSAQWEVKNSKVKDHIAAMKLYHEKETLNTKFVSEVMRAMKANNVSKVVLVCRSGPRSKAAANMLAKEGIEAYNLDGGFVFGWRESNMPWGGN